MKKIMITLTLIMMLANMVFAGNDKIKPEVLEAFRVKFTIAQNVTWEAGSNYYKADFTYNGMRMFALYSSTAELLSLTRNIPSEQLPFYLQAKLYENYTGYRIAGVFEVSDQAGFRYYVNMENEARQVVLESENGNSWNVFKKTRRQSDKYGSNSDGSKSKEDRITIPATLFEKGDAEIELNFNTGNSGASGDAIISPLSAALLQAADDEAVRRYAAENPVIDLHSNSYLLKADCEIIRNFKQANA
jgi:hypothetical protein